MSGDCRRPAREGGVGRARSLHRRPVACTATRRRRTGGSSRGRLAGSGGGGDRRRRRRRAGGGSNSIRGVSGDCRRPSREGGVGRARSLHRSRRSYREGGAFSASTAITVTTVVLPFLNFIPARASACACTSSVVRRRRTALWAFVGLHSAVRHELGNAKYAIFELASKREPSGVGVRVAT